MRTIKFRGRDNQGEWHYGYLVIRLGITYIFEEIWEYYRDSYVKTDKFKEIEVSADTVGQFVELYDKNGKEIYEGDILRVRVLVQDYDFSDEFWRVGFIKFVSGKFVLVNCTNYATSDLTIKHDYSPCKTTQCTYPKYRSEIIGNIYDNPDLLKGE